MASKMREWKHAYRVTSERWLSDETDVEWFTDKEYEVGQMIADSEGLNWLVLEIIK